MERKHITYKITTLSIIITLLFSYIDFTSLNVYAAETYDISSFYWHTWPQLETGKALNMDSIEIDTYVDNIYKYLEYDEDYVCEGYISVPDKDTAYDVIYSGDYNDYSWNVGVPSKANIYVLKLKGINKFSGHLYLLAIINERYALNSFYACREKNDDLHMYLNNQSWDDIILRSQNISSRKQVYKEDYDGYGLEYQYSRIDLKYNKDFIYAGYYTSDEYFSLSDDELGKGLHQGLPNSEGEFYIKTIPTSGSIYKGVYYFGIELFDTNIEGFRYSSNHQIEDGNPYNMNALELYDNRINDSKYLDYNVDYTCVGYKDITGYDGWEDDYIEEYGTDFALQSGIPKEAGKYILKLKGKGAYKGEKYVMIDIESKYDLSNYRVAYGDFDGSFGNFIDGPFGYIAVNPKDENFWKSIVLRHTNINGRKQVLVPEEEGILKWEGYDLEYEYKPVDLQKDKDFVISGYYTSKKYYEDYYDDCLGKNIKAGLPYTEGEYYIRVSPANGSAYYGEKYFYVELDDNAKMIEIKQKDSYEKSSNLNKNSNSGSIIKAVKTFADKNFNYKVSKQASAKSNGEVIITGLKKKSLKKIKIPKTVKYKGYTYKVTKIGENAFKNNKKITSVEIGGNVKTIGTNAFYGCKKLKNINIKGSKISSIGKNAFYRKGGKKLTIKVPKSMKKVYKKLLKKSKTNKYIVK